MFVLHGLWCVKNIALQRFRIHSLTCNTWKALKIRGNVQQLGDNRAVTQSRCKEHPPEPLAVCSEKSVNRKHYPTSSFDEITE